jgi:nucleotide-binding universal stress UspA family protein
MPNHPTIIAAVDLDSRACGVIDHAAKLAALCQGDLLVVHVVDYEGGYESDHIPHHSPQQVLSDMVRHARASLVGLVHHLDLPTSPVEIRVESGPTASTLIALAATIRPRYVLVGHSRWGLLSPTSGLASTLESQAGCELLVVPQHGDDASGSGLIKRVQHWLAGEPALPSKRPR